MKLTEIMIIKKDDTGNRLKLFQVDDETMSKLTRIRGNLFKDDQRLTVVKDLPTPTPEPVYSPAAIEATEKAVALYKLMQESKVTTSHRVIEPEKKPMTFEDQIENDWRHSPALRKEFTSFGSYQAFKRMEKEGRTRLYGCKA